MHEPFVGLLGGPMHWVFDKSAIFGARPGTCRSSRAAPTRSRDSDNAELTRLAAQADRRRRCPSAATRRLVRSRRRPRAARDVLARAGRAAPPGHRTSMPGFYLAGDWTDTGLPGTIEGAVVSGHRAARWPSLGAEHNHPSMTSVRHRPLRRARAQGQEPAVVHHACWCASVRAALADLDVVETCARARPDRGRLGPGADWEDVRERLARLPGIGNFARADARRADLDAIAAARPRAASRPDCRDDVPRRGAARRQAVSRCRRRRSSARSAGACRRRTGWPSISRSPRLHDPRRDADRRGVLLLRQGAGRGRPAGRHERHACCACSRAASIRRSRRGG